MSHQVKNRNSADRICAGINSRKLTILNCTSYIRTSIITQGYKILPVILLLLKINLALPLTKYFGCGLWVDGFKAWKEFLESLSFRCIWNQRISLSKVLDFEIFQKVNINYLLKSKKYIYTHIITVGIRIK